MEVKVEDLVSLGDVGHCPPIGWGQDYEASCGQRGAPSALRVRSTSKDKDKNITIIATKFDELLRSTW